MLLPAMTSIRRPEAAQQEMICFQSHVVQSGRGQHADEKKPDRGEQIHGKREIFPDQAQPVRLKGRVMLLRAQPSFIMENSNGQGYIFHRQFRICIAAHVQFMVSENRVF
jgi:hypothetical protein